jgi:Tfp pilus assembly protein PilF
MNLNQEINNIIVNINNKKFNEAIHLCENLINLNYENTIIYNLQGRAYQNLGLYEESIQKFNRSIELNQNNYFALNNLGISLKAIEKYKLSEEAYKKCLKIKADYIFAIINYADLKEFLYQIDEAIKLYLSTLDLKLNNNHDYVLSKLCKLYIAKGNINEARNYSLKLLKKHPSVSHFYQLHSEIVDLDKDKNYLSDMKALFEKKDLTDDDIINLSFPLGKAYEKLKHYEKAFNYFEKGNHFKKKKINFNIENVIKLSNSIKKVFNNPKFQKTKKKKSDKKIIFICGLPRSGTTLLDQIISSHGNVVSTGESGHLGRYIKKNYFNNFSLDEEKIYKDNISKDNLFGDYVYNLFDEFKYVSKVFTDKSVQNFFWIGFIKIFFPNSKIIVTERKPEDVCLSIFKNNFESSYMNFSYDQKDIANFYKVYKDLIEFWKKTYENELFVVKYENLVENPEIEIKKIINYCGLKWDSNCLYPHKNKSIIKTASITQARLPIYKSSKDLSNYYYSYLEQMFKLIKN